MHNYKELEIWKNSVVFCPKIYKITATFPVSERFGLISQLTRAVISIPSNIAEDSAKSSDKHFIIFFRKCIRFLLRNRNTIISFKTFKLYR